MTDSLFDVELQVGEIVSAEEFNECRKPQMMKLKVDIGEETLNSAAQLGYNYDPEDVEGRQVLAATNLGTVNIAGFESQCLTVGVPDEDGNAVLVSPDDDVPLGGRLH